MIALALPSCQKDNDTTDGGNHEASLTEFSATIATDGNSATSKTYIRNGWDFLQGNCAAETYFDTQDTIGIFAADSTAAPFTMKNGKASDKTVTFAGVTKKSDHYYALLPYQGNATIHDGVISARIPTEQTSYNNIDGNAALHVAYAADSDRQLTFRNATATIAFYANYLYISKIDVEAIDGTMIAGDVSITVSQDGSAPTVSGGTSSKISINTRYDYNATFAASLKPCTLKPGALKITYHKTDGSSFEQINDLPITLHSGEYYLNGRIGDKKLTCYADETRSKILFTRFANSQSMYVSLPSLDLDVEEGYMYYYNTSPNGKGTAYDFGQTIEITDNTDIYLQKSKACLITIYNPEGKEVLYEKKARCLSKFTFPYLYSAETDEDYAFCMEKGGAIFARSYVFFDVPDLPSLTFYTITQGKIYVTIYGDGADKEPTVRQRIQEGYQYTLPEINRTEEGYEYVYSTQPDGAMEYIPGDRILYEDGDITLYPVKIKVNDIDLTGHSLGNAVKYSWIGTTEILETEPNTVSIYKFRPFIVQYDSWQIRLDCGENYHCQKSMYGYEGEDRSTYAKYPVFNYGNSQVYDIDNSDITVKFYNKGSMCDVQFFWKEKSSGQTQSMCYYRSLLTNNRVQFIVNGCYLLFNYKETDEKVKLTIYDENGAIADQKEFKKGMDITLPTPKPAPDGYEYVYSTTPNGKMEHTAGYTIHKVSEDVKLYLVKVKVNVISMQGLVLYSDRDKTWVTFDGFPPLEPGCVNRLQYTQVEVPNPENYHVRFDIDGGKTGMASGGWVDPGKTQPAQTSGNAWIFSTETNICLNLDDALVTVSIYHKGETADLKYDWHGSIDDYKYYSYGFDFPISSNGIVLVVNDATVTIK